MTVLERRFKTIPTDTLISMLVTLEDTHTVYKTSQDRDLIFSIRYELKQRNVTIPVNARESILNNKQRHADYIGSTYNQVKTGRV